MKLAIRVEPKISSPDLRSMIEERTRLALTRLSPRLLGLNINVGVQTQRDGGRAICRVSGSFDGGGILQASSREADPREAVKFALDRFRRAAFRDLDRKCRNIAGQRTRYSRAHLVANESGAGAL